MGSEGSDFLHHFKKCDIRQCIFFIDAFSGARSRTQVLYMTQKPPYLRKPRILKTFLPPKNAPSQTPHAMQIHNLISPNLPQYLPSPPLLLLPSPLNQPHSFIRNILTNPPTPQHNPLLLKDLLRSLPPPQPHLLFLTVYRLPSIRVVGAAIAIVIVAAAPAIAETIAGVLGCCCWVG